MPDQTTVWDDVYFSAGNRIAESDLSPIDKDILLSIFSAGAGCAGRFYDDLNDLFRRFGDVTFERALPFVEVFTMAMVSRWVRQACDQSEEFDPPAMWARFARSVLNLFGTFSEERYEEARLMDVQFNFGRDARVDGQKWAVGLELQEADMIMSLAARSLGAKLGGKLSSSAIPAKGSYELSKDTGIEAFTTDLRLLSKAQDTLTANEAGMYASFKALQKDKRSVRSKITSLASRLGGAFRKRD